MGPLLPVTMPVTRHTDRGRTLPPGTHAAGTVGLVTAWVPQPRAALRLQLHRPRLLKDGTHTRTLVLLPSAVTTL